VKSAWLTDIDMRAGVAPPTTTVPCTPEAVEAGGLDTGGDDTGAELDAGVDAGADDAGPDGSGPDGRGPDGGGLNACGLLTAGNALDADGEWPAFDACVVVQALARSTRSPTAAEGAVAREQDIRPSMRQLRVGPG
jgi:hypothetical protein